HEVTMLGTAAPPAQLYTLSLHDALPISHGRAGHAPQPRVRDAHPQRAHLAGARAGRRAAAPAPPGPARSGGDLPRPGRQLRDERSEEHTSELQSREKLVCRLLLEKKKLS